MFDISNLLLNLLSSVKQLTSNRILAVIILFSTSFLYIPIYSKNLPGTAEQWGVIIEIVFRFSIIVFLVKIFYSLKSYGLNKWRYYRDSKIIKAENLMPTAKMILKFYIDIRRQKPHNIQIMLWEPHLTEKTIQSYPMISNLKKNNFIEYSILCSDNWQPIYRFTEEAQRMLDSKKFQTELFKDFNYTVSTLFPDIALNTKQSELNEEVYIIKVTVPDVPFT